VYPTATARLFSDLVGYDSIKYGTWGIEYQYNDQLIAHAQPARSLSQFLNPTTATDDVTLTVQPSCSWRRNRPRRARRRDRGAQPQHGSGVGHVRQPHL